MSISGLEASAYQGIKVLVTGGLGFMGINLALALYRVGAQVRLLDIVWPLQDAELLAALKAMEFIKADLRDESLIEEAVQGCEVIFNLAGRSGAAASNSSPLDDLDINCRGHLTLLEACRKHNTGVRIVFPSSRLVYAPHLSGLAAESAPTDPVSLYGIHKLTVEKYHRLYSQLYGLRTTVLRITNPYGPHQWHEQRRYGIINWFIYLALTNQTLPIYGDGRQLRDYIHIDDLVRAFLRAGTDERAVGQVFNVGSGEAIEFAHMARRIVELAGSGQVEHLPWPAAVRQVETGDFVADNRRIVQALHWRPTISFDQGLRQVVDYYRHSYPS